MKETGNALVPRTSSSTKERRQRILRVRSSPSPRSVKMDFALGALFTDHLVLQQKRENLIWGRDRPGHRIRLRVLGAPGEPERTALARADGSFRIACPELPAGGPYELDIEGSARRVLGDVLVGEVWLGSGQSNMAWQVAHCRDAEQEIARANWPALRMFNVGRRAARNPSCEADGEWLVCSPDTVEEFSAVGYFFARELWQALRVPIGVINASWGGTSILSWLSSEALRALDPEHDAKLRVQERELPALRQSYEETLAAWQRRNLPSDPPNRVEALGIARPDFDDRELPEMRLPKFWQDAGLSFNGVVWFRKVVELPAAWAGRDLLLSLGAIDDFDHSYWNGELVGAQPEGSFAAHQIPRRYSVPGRWVRAGKNAIAVRVFDHYGQGGFAGPRGALFIECPAVANGKLRLDGAWRYQVEHAIPLVSSAVFDSYPQPPLGLVPEHTPSALFNGMLHPLIPYGLRGAIWYQGESDVERHLQYRAGLLGLIRDLRARFAQGQFPFYLVQLANHRASNDWPHLREAQAQVLSEPVTGMAVSIDIGEADDIHPRNKQEVGRRLALLARARTYGESGLCDSGPILEKIEIRGETARVLFAHAGGLGTCDGQPPKGFELAGDDRVFHEAEARLEHDSVLLRTPAVSAPALVRYAWRDQPEVNLINQAGLPAAPFRSDGY